MSLLTVTDARAKLYALIEETLTSHKPVVITSKKGNAVLLSESDWNAIEETLFLLSVPGMRDSLLEGMNEDVASCSKELDW